MGENSLSMRNNRTEYVSFSLPAIRELSQVFFFIVESLLDYYTYSNLFHIIYEVGTSQSQQFLDSVSSIMITISNFITGLARS